MLLLAFALASVASALVRMGREGETSAMSSFAPSISDAERVLAKELANTLGGKTLDYDVLTPPEACQPDVDKFCADSPMLLNCLEKNHEKLSDDCLLGWVGRIPYVCKSQVSRWCEMQPAKIPCLLNVVDDLEGRCRLVIKAASAVQHQHLKPHERMHEEVTWRSAEHDAIVTRKVDDIRAEAQRKIELLHAQRASTETSHHHTPRPDLAEELRAEPTEDTTPNLAGDPRDLATGEQPMASQPMAPVPTGEQSMASDGPTASQPASQQPAAPVQPELHAGWVNFLKEGWTKWAIVLPDYTLLRLNGLLWCLGVFFVALLMRNFSFKKLRTNSPESENLLKKHERHGEMFPNTFT